MLGRRVIVANSLARKRAARIYTDVLPMDIRNIYPRFRKNNVTCSCRLCRNREEKGYLKTKWRESLAWVKK